MALDPAVQELLDRAHIGDTIYAYCDYVDQAEIDRLVDLFAVDGQMDLGGGAVYHGHGDLSEMFTDRLRLYTTTSFHCAGVHVVRYDTMTATTTTTFYGFHDTPAQKRQMHLFGRWEDEMVNESGRWLFRRRRLRVAGINHTVSDELPRRFTRIDRHQIDAEEPDSFLRSFAREQH